MKMEEERWLPAVAYAAWYEISDWGNVYSLPRAAAHGGLLALQINSAGYHIVRLSKYGRVRTVTVGSLVLATFVRPPLPGERARHGPRGKLDDHLDNLWWG
jgi:NUMOD4 motif-containing protein